jgi:hypothetical protein
MRKAALNNEVYISEKSITALEIGAHSDTKIIDSLERSYTETVDYLTRRYTYVEDKGLSVKDVYVGLQGWNHLTKMNKYSPLVHVFDALEGDDEVGLLWTAKIHLLKSEAKSYNGFKTGDLMTTYHKGYWRLTHIKLRFDSDGKKSPLFTYAKVADSNFKKCGGARSCDASYCKKVDEKFIDELREDLNLKINKLEEFAKENIVGLR